MFRASPVCSLYWEDLSHWLLTIYGHLQSQCGLLRLLETGKTHEYLSTDYVYICRFAEQKRQASAEIFHNLAAQNLVL